MENYMLSDVKEYLSVNLNDYKNIGINFEINKFILFCAIALCIVAFYVNYKRSLMVNIVKQLLRKNAIDEESAKTLVELKLDSSRGIKKAIFTSSQLRRLISIVGESRPTYEEYVAAQKAKKKIDSPDPTAVRIYIKAESLDRAKHIYNTYNVSILNTLLACALIIAFGVCLVLVMPELLTVINGSLAA